jgi:GH43 family beta-xylosidase
LFCCYSGWPLGDDSDTQQDLFLVELARPETAMRETLTCISRAELDWERPDGGRRGVNEGPTYLNLNLNHSGSSAGGRGGGFEGIIYSANGSWTSDYRLGVLQLTGDDPLRASSWRKRSTPLLQSDNNGPTGRGPFGPGHASFIPSPYGDGRVYCIYHATDRKGEGWNNRKARVLCLGPDDFFPHAQTVSTSASVQHDGGAQNQGQSTATTEARPHADAAQRRSLSRSLVDRIGDKVMRKLREL